MKVLMILVLLIAACAADETRRNIANLIEDIIYEAADYLAENGLDPLYLDDYKFDIDHKKLSLKGNLYHATITGLMSVDIETLSISALRREVRFSFVWEDIHAEGDYECDGYVLRILPLYGAGPFSIDIEELVLSGSFRVEFTDTGALAIHDVDLSGSIDSFTGSIDHILASNYITEEINSYLNENVPTIFAEVVAESTGLVTDAVNSLLNSSAQGNFGIPINGLVDDYLITLREEIRNDTDLDPLHLEDEIIDFTLTPFKMTVDGSLQFIRGMVYGLSNVRRTGECLVGLAGPRYLPITLRLGLTDLHVMFRNTSLNVGLVSIPGSFYGTLSDLELLVTVQVDIFNYPFDGGLQGTLLDFKVERLGTMSTEIVGIPFLESVTSQILETGLNFLLPILQVALQKALLPIVENIVEG